MDRKGMDAKKYNIVWFRNRVLNTTNTTTKVQDIDFIVTGVSATPKCFPQLLEIIHNPILCRLLTYLRKFELWKLFSKQNSTFNLYSTNHFIFPSSFAKHLFQPLPLGLASVRSISPNGTSSP